jgi:hypothetical protein
MKTISTMRVLLAGALLLISILTGCQKDPQPSPKDPQFIPEDVYIFGSTNSKTPAPIAVPVRN